jgi:hypothetical protein
LSDAKHWDSVVDFRWHRTTPSPHWHAIPPLKRIQGLPEEIISAGWSLNIPVKIDSNIVDNCEKDVESNIESLDIRVDGRKSVRKEEIVEEEEEEL